MTLDLANNTLFTPHYYILDGRNWKCDTKFPKCGNQCTNQGRYCAVDPERDLDLGISGLDVVQEDLRQLCIWKFSTVSILASCNVWFYVLQYNSFDYPCTVLLHKDLNQPTMNQCGGNIQCYGMIIALIIQIMNIHLILVVHMSK